MMKKLLMISIALCLTACSSTNAPIEQTSAQYNPKNQARIRLYGQNGHSSTIHYGIDCHSTNNKGVEFNVGGASIGQAFSSLIRLSVLDYSKFSGHLKTFKFLISF